MGRVLGLGSMLFLLCLSTATDGALSSRFESVLYNTIFYPVPNVLLALVTRFKKPKTQWKEGVQHAHPLHGAHIESTSLSVGKLKFPRQGPLVKNTSSLFLLFPQLEVFWQEVAGSYIHCVEYYIGNSTTEPLWPQATLTLLKL